MPLNEAFAGDPVDLLDHQPRIRIEQLSRNVRVVPPGAPGRSRPRSLQLVGGPEREHRHPGIHRTLARVLSCHAARENRSERIGRCRFGKYTDSATPVPFRIRIRLQAHRFRLHPVDAFDQLAEIRFLPRGSGS